MPTLSDTAITRVPVKVRHRHTNAEAWAVDFDPSGGVDIGLFATQQQAADAAASSEAPITDRMYPFWEIVP